MNIVSTEFGDIAIHLNDLIGKTLTRDLIWEPYNIALMRQYINEGDVVLDIGANIGFFSVVLSKIVGDNGKVHAFEPVLENFKLLEFNCSKLSNTVLHYYALGNETGNVTLSSEHGNMGNSYITNESAGDIKLLKLDDLAIDPKFIKLDVQGFEYDVLLGGLETIKSNRPVMIIELEDSNGSIPTSFRQSKENSLRLLKELNYNVYNVISDYPVDYLCIPNELDNA
jgi:FkbM family methyltransferase